MGNTTKTKAAMLNELESIKGLLLEADDIPILQEEVPEEEPEPIAFIASQPETDFELPSKNTPARRTIFEEQQDFFHSPITNSIDHRDHQATTAAAMELVETELLETLNELEKQTAEVTAGKPLKDVHKNTAVRPNLAKATGENPFLPEHIRSRLHGNNPPPLFANETARKIAHSSIPTRQLGNTFGINSPAKSNHQQDLIDSIIDKMMPEIEQELRSRLELMSKTILDELNK